MADGGENLASQAERWPWFIDILFGVVATKGIEKYAEQFLALWPQGGLQVLQSLIVAAGIALFVVYDIAIYHVLVRKFRFTFSKKGFVRLYLDLGMVFLLYLLLVEGLKPKAQWAEVLIIVSTWHFMAALWHILARWEHNVKGNWQYAILPHYGFILCYWTLPALAWWVLPIVATPSVETRSQLLLLLACLTIGGVSWFRWGQVLKRFAEPKAVRH